MQNLHSLHNQKYWETSRLLGRRTLITSACVCVGGGDFLHFISDKQGPLEQLSTTLSRPTVLGTPSFDLLLECKRKWSVYSVQEVSARLICKLWSQLMSQQARLTFQASNQKSPQSILQIIPLQVYVFKQNAGNPSSELGVLPSLSVLVNTRQCLSLSLAYKHLILLLCILEVSCGAWQCCVLQWVC